MYIDPKGTGRNEYQHKVDGYRSLFTDNDEITQFKFEDLNISVHLKLATDDLNAFAQNDYYKKYWFDINKFELNLK